jgi:hypothetical protein
MTQEKENVADEQLEESNSEQEGKNQDPENESQGAKTFTQAELDEIVESRLARERSSQGRKLDNVESALKAAEKRIEHYEKILSKQVESQTKDLPDSVKKLLAKLSVQEQLEWLADPSNSITQRSSSPKTPLERRDEKEIEPKPVRKII